MGLIKKLIRSFRQLLSNVFGFITRRNSREKRRHKYREPVEVPRSWDGKGEQPRKKDLIRIKHKRRIPGLKQINRLLAGFWLFLNFVFSQFLLGSVGSQAQWIFFFFLGNCYFIIKYLWGSRRGESGKRQS